MLIDKYTIINLKFALVARILIEWYNRFLIVCFLEEHTNIFLEDKSSPYLVTPPGIIIEALGLIVIDDYGIVCLFTNGAFLIIVQIPQSQMADTAHTIVATGKFRSHVCSKVAEANNTHMPVSLGINFCRCHSLVTHSPINFVQSFPCLFLE